MATQLKDMISIDSIIKEMTLDEKAILVNGGSPFSTAALEKYGILAMLMIDSCNGVNSMELMGEKLYQKMAADATAAGQPFDREKYGYMGGLLLALGGLKRMAAEQEKSGAPASPKPFGCYPPGISLGATWNPAVVEDCGHTMAAEMSHYGVDVILGPNVNIHRDPLCGRLAESYSEDPFLVSKLAPAMVKGIQEEGVAACVKHYAANNQEKDRIGVNEHIPERALREIYLPGFKACVDAGCKTLMSSYNRINGTLSSTNPWLLKDVLRKEWDFQGFVVSDWGGSPEVAASVASGNDLVMPGPRGIEAVKKDIADGVLTEAELDQAVRNILRVLITVPAFTGKRSVLDRAASLSVMENALRESMILLKNDGTLPLSIDRCDVVVCGKRSKNPTICSAGSSNVATDLTTNLYDSAVDLIGDVHVTFQIPTAAARYWIVVAGCDGREGADREDLSMDADDISALEQAITEANTAGGKVILVINATGPVDLLPFEDRVNAILCPFFGGIQSGKITAEAIWGKFNPSGKLPLTWPKHEYDRPAYKNYGGEKQEVWYGEGIYVGYRWYDARRIEPMYPFGHGMSYTTFDITDVMVPESVIVEENDIPVTITVKNTGKTAGSEVVQVYVRDCEPKFDRPEKELKGFRKVFLQPGEEKVVNISVSKADLAGFCMELSEWITHPGKYEILVGTSALNICHTRSIKVRCLDPFGLSLRSAIGKIIKNNEAVAAINQILEDDILILNHVAIEFAPDKSLQELWHGTGNQNAFKNKGWSPEEISRRYEKIRQLFIKMASV